MHLFDRLALALGRILKAGIVIVLILSVLFLVIGAFVGGVVLAAVFIVFQMALPVSFVVWVVWFLIRDGHRFGWLKTVFIVIGGVVGFLLVVLLVSVLTGPMGMMVLGNAIGFLVLVGFVVGIVLLVRRHKSRRGPKTRIPMSMYAPPREHIANLDYYDNL